MGIITWIVVGFVAGLIARALLPGRQAMGLIATTGLGIVGSLLGGIVGNLIWGRGQFQGFTIGGLALAVLGSVIVLFLYTRFRKPVTNV